MLSALSIYSHAQNPVSFSIGVKAAKVKAGDKLTAQISASIASGWHMYSTTQGAGGPIPTRINVADGQPFKLAGVVSGPRPHVAFDPNFEINTETYEGSVTFNVPVAAASDASAQAQRLNIDVRYQVCNDTTCLPPKTVKLTASVEIIAATAAAAQTSPSPALSLSPPPNANLSVNSNKNSNSNANSITNANTANTNSEVLALATQNDGQSANTASASPATISSTVNDTQAANSSLWSFIWLAMSLGALSVLTPCVFPMIPITVFYFSNHSAGDRARSIKLATIYSLGIIATFTLLGILIAILVGAAGINLFAANPWVNLLITGIFLFFAFNLFGAYEITVPAGILTKLDGLTRSKEGEGSGVVGALLIGLTFTLTSFTCTSPFVGTILVSASNGNWQKPLVGMLAFSTVFALPFFVLALAPQLISQLPRAGGWMNSVKVAMGFLEVAAAMKFLSNVDLVWKWHVFTREVVLAVWIAIGVVLAFYLLGKFQLAHDSKPERIGAARLASAVASLAIAFYLLTGLFGSPLGELESFLPPTTEIKVSGIRVVAGNQKVSSQLNWITNDYETALKKAKEENKSIFIDFTGYTCTNCRWMEANMFSKPEVSRELGNYVLVRLYTDGEGKPYEDFQKMQEEKFSTVALPFYAVIKPTGEKIKTFPGLTRDETEFLSFLKTGQEKFVAVNKSTRASSAE
jgi:thiol:disulfide interchange protein